jgi:hypothetical protein
VKVRFYGIAVLAVVCLPLLFWRLSLVAYPDSYRQMPQVFRTFGVCVSAALALAVYIEYRGGRTLAGDRAVPYMLGVLVAGFFLRVIVTDMARSFDYQCYEGAARALLHGQNPYPGAYIYPPLLAQAMAFCYKSCAWLAGRTGLTLPETTLWNGVFYLYEAGQYLLILLAYLLCYRLCRITGLNRKYSSALVAALLVFNGPLLRTLQEKQVNLLIMDAVLLAMLAVWSFPRVSGWAVAFGTLIKLYPAALMAPCFLSRRFKAIEGFAAGLAGLLLVGAFLDGKGTVWLEYVSMMRAFPEQPNPGNISLNGMAASLLSIAGKQGNMHGGIVSVVLLGIAAAVKAALVVWIAFRFVHRHRLDQREGTADNVAVFYDNAMDILALGLLVSPVLWDHHFVILIPFSIWAVATRARLHPWAIGISVFLMLGQSSLDMFPLHFQRVVGLVLLLWCTQPGVQAKDAPAVQYASRRT